MANITTKNTEHSEFTSATPIEPINPISEVNTLESDRFAKLVNIEEENESSASETENNNETLTLEDIQHQFMDSTFRSGFNKTIDKAKEIIKEMKS